MLHVVRKDDLLDSGKPGTRSANLRHHVQAVAPILEHGRQPTHLPLDLGQARKHFLVSWLRYHTPV